MIIETERLILRPFTDADSEPFVAIHADPEVMHFYPGVWSEEQSLSSIQHAKDGLANDGFGLLAAELKSTGACIGTIGLVKLDDVMREATGGEAEVEIGWRLQHNVWGQGLGPEGAKACLDYAWETLKLAQVVAFTAEINTPSQRVMQKIGMISEGSFQHPTLEPDHRLQPHVLYRIKNPNN